MRVTATSYFAEYIGAFFFILAIFVSMGNPLVIGAALALVIYLTADVSGGRGAVALGSNWHPSCLACGPAHLACTGCVAGGSWRAGWGARAASRVAP